ncbi:MAG: hypothetical protein M0P19_08395 [Nevskia sp.]|jgi:hypothetical protein|nr:hypothetical protein [Nevskia sp.]MCK9386556.1 hypothetical protein [Nevskia sp.]
MKHQGTPRLIGRQLAVPTKRVEISDFEGRHKTQMAGRTTIEYTTIDGFREVDFADNGDAIP